MYFQHHQPEYNDYVKAQDHKGEFDDYNRQQTIRHFNKNNEKEVSLPSIYKYNFSDWVHDQCRVVGKDSFQGLIVTLVVINTIQLGIATMDFVTDYSHTSELFHRVDILFMMVFTTEIAMQFGYRGKALFRDIWLTADVVLVGLTWVLILIPFFREFRVLRAFRLIVK